MSLVHNFVWVLVWAINFAILGRVVMSWISPRGDDPISQMLLQITEPILEPIRRVMPKTGIFDLAPMVALLALNLIIAPIALQIL